MGCLMTISLCNRLEEKVETLKNLKPIACTVITYTFDTSIAMFALRLSPVALRAECNERQPVSFVL